MRTLKVLSLVLALVLCFGLVGTAFAAPANFEGYTDADKIGDEYVEAADVMMGLGIIEGKTADTVDPTGNFTREQAAKIIAYMLMGKEAADKLTASVAPFADVAANRWSAGFIAFCADQKVVSGVGNGNFNPTGTLTGFQFAKMLLAAVGYNANDEYEGASWSINVAKDAIQKGVFDGDLAAATNAPIQRQQAILMAFNTLTDVARVTYSDLLKQYVAYGAGLLGTAVAPTYLAENYGLGAVVGSSMVYGEPAAATTETGAKGHVWKVGAKAISEIYPDGEVAGRLEDAGAVTGTALNKAYSWDTTPALTVFVNGKSDTTVAGKVTSGNAAPFAGFEGYEAQLLDSDNDGLVDEIIILAEYLGYVTNVTPAGVTLNVFNKAFGTDNDPTATGANTATLTPEIGAGLTKGDFVIIIPNDSQTKPFDAPLSVKKAEPVTTKLTEYTTTGTPSVTYGGAKHTFAGKADLIPAECKTTPKPTLDFTINYFVFLSSKGAVLGFVAAEAVTVAAPNFMYVVDSAADAGAPATLLTPARAPQVKVQGVLMDGTKKVFDVVIYKNSANKDVSDINGVGAYTVTTGTPLTAKSVYAYTLNDKGEILTLDIATNGSAFGTSGYTTDWTSTATKKITVNAGNAVVTGLPFVGGGKYATTSTNLVVGGSSITTYVGYDKFPGTSSTPKDLEVGTGAGKCAAIVAVSKGALVTDILIVDQAAATTTLTNTEYGVFTGVIVQRPNANDVDTPYYQFQKADGTKVEYAITNTTALTSTDKGTVYELTIKNGMATYASMPTAQEGLSIAEITDTYIVIGSTVYYTTDVPVLDISGATYKAGVLKAGLTTLTITLDSKGNLTGVFIK